ncbi:MAG TPA: DUF1573 domain-containing protein [Bacteroidales bacterium]|nr:MAG: hypothetical protein A2W98_14940 [Bacteroidetes bacterium GWF2_33_38]OFY90886.1 MAG: hypothetical protein A2236_12090 [Bacteroidetes bacterium RIFOXYA2_FULL_33_7]HBF88369.1 DUF1573 domain-containing protein [Bacteroidales bacterium]
MKKIKSISLILIFALAFFVSCNNDSKKDNSKIDTDIVKNPITANGNSETGDLPQISFKKEDHDFGAIIQGEKVSFTFKYTNTGGSDLIITSAKGSCGCTVPKFNKTPLKPGEEGEIEVVFDSSGRKGIQHKTITVLSNTQPNTVTLKIVADVVVPN